MRLDDGGFDERLHRGQVSQGKSEAAFGRPQVAIWRPAPSAHIDGGVRPVLPQFHPQTFVLIDRKRYRPDRRRVGAGRRFSIALARPFDYFTHVQVVSLPGQR